MSFNVLSGVSLCFAQLRSRSHCLNFDIFRDRAPLRNVLWNGNELYYHAHITAYHIWGVEVSFCVCQGLVPYMASPLTLSQSPICSRRSWKIGSILPSDVGPMSISKFPPQLLQKRVKSITHSRLIGTLDNTPFYLICFVFPIYTTWCSPGNLPYAYLKKTVLWGTITWSEIEIRNLQDKTSIGTAEVGLQIHSPPMRIVRPNVIQFATNVTTTNITI